jgi:phosphoribosyl-AMP cyclohydrolase / phosphoribosyl-ATP pyrophosphohydrolase
MRIRSVADAGRLDFDKGSGLLPIIAQDARTGAVLMMAYCTRESVERTLDSGDMWYHSRSRGQLWRKGDTSGNVQRLVALYDDCDRDALLALVLPAGPACHTGAATCFDGLPALPALARAIGERAAAGAAPGERPSYTQRLLGDRNLRLKKLGEEAVELALASAAGDTAKIAEEAADLIYHVLVAAAAEGVDAGAVFGVLQQRRSAMAADDQHPVEK